MAQTWTKIEPKDFVSSAFRHEVVSREQADRGEDRRFHLKFSYIVPGHGHVSNGERVVHARDMGQAAVRIANERGVDQLFVRKRYFSNKPASEAEDINVVFDIAAAAAEA
ncbi:hypothetical protein ATER59S_02375 [Aquamicrobium terrae]